MKLRCRLGWHNWHYLNFVTPGQWSPWCDNAWKPARRICLDCRKCQREVKSKRRYFPEGSEWSGFDPEWVDCYDAYLQS